ncbi:hypothetical protein [uncultured Sulfitobacter sp.]|uniref:DUF7742 family protein n=1 Tax=uncultured Sulfitobacter sp. TaxID=191468 RepID=UPI002624733E|nr:hypothetical protein [uncultured Sulfitobacter sp.]
MDLHHAARAVQMVPPPARRAFSDGLLMRAHAADKYVKRLRKLHPLWGDGSLRAAALACAQADDSAPHDPSLRGCYHLVLQSIDCRAPMGR